MCLEIILSTKRELPAADFAEVHVGRCQPVSGMKGRYFYQVTANQCACDFIGGSNKKREAEAVTYRRALADLIRAGQTLGGVRVLMRWTDDEGTQPIISHVDHAETFVTDSEIYHRATREPCLFEVPYAGEYA